MEYVLGISLQGCARIEMELQAIFVRGADTRGAIIINLDTRIVLAIVFMTIAFVIIITARTFYSEASSKEYPVDIAFLNMDIRTSGDSRIIESDELVTLSKLYNSFYETGECDG